MLFLAGMGKGQHRMPTKDELVQRYNRMNTIPQVRGTEEPNLYYTESLKEFCFQNDIER